MSSLVTVNIMISPQICISCVNVTSVSLYRSANLISLSILGRTTEGLYSCVVNSTKKTYYFDFCAVFINYSVGMSGGHSDHLPDCFKVCLMCASRNKWLYLVPLISIIISMSSQLSILSLAPILRSRWIC